MGTIFIQLRKTRISFCSVIQGLTSALDGDEWSTSRPECFNTVWTLRKREKSFAHAGNRTTIPPLSSPWTSHPEVSGQRAKNVSKSVPQMKETVLI